MAKKTPTARKPREATGRAPARLTEAYVIDATRAAKNFGALVNMVRETGAVYAVERGGVPVVHVSPARADFSGRDMVDYFRSAARGDGALAREVEAGRVESNRPTVVKDPWAS